MIFYACGNTKLLDFGFASTTDWTSPGREVANAAYTAPEVALKGQFSPQDDVFAFGILLNEMCTREKPFPDVNHLPTVYIMVGRGERPIKAGQHPPELVQMIEARWNDSPQRRPAFSDLYARLRDLRCQYVERSTFTVPEPSTAVACVIDDEPRSSQQTCLLSRPYATSCPVVFPLPHRSAPASVSKYLLLPARTLAGCPVCFTKNSSMEKH